MRKSIIAIVVATFSTLYATSASAAGPSAALLVGNGFKDGFNLGFGARGGFTLPMNLYVGGTLVYHLGKSESTAFGDASVKVLYVGAEGGYEISAGPLIVRPFVGLGYASASVSIPNPFGGGTISNSTGKAALWPGAVALFPIGSAFVGADLRYVIILDSDNGQGESLAAFSAFATGGLNF